VVIAVHSARTSRTRAAGTSAILPAARTVPDEADRERFSKLLTQVPPDL
jgi:hypothetical protein